MQPVDRLCAGKSGKTRKSFSYRFKDLIKAFLRLEKEQIGCIPTILGAKRFMMLLRRQA